MTTIPEGGFRLHWRSYPFYAEKRSQDFTCLNDALTHAAILYARDGIENFLRLENWCGEDACPPEQLLPVAKMRTKAALEAHDREKAQEALEQMPGYASF